MCIWQILLKNAQTGPVTSRKTTDSIRCQWWNPGFQAKIIQCNKLFRKYHLSSFVIVIKKNSHRNLKRVLKYSSFFQQHISVRLNFLYVLQPKQRIINNYEQKQIKDW